MWTTIISSLALAGFVALARYLFGASNALGDGGMGMAVIGYGCVVVAGLAAFVLTYKAATIGLS